MGHKAGFISIVGKPNVGKSTLMNKLLGERLSIVTPKAQTTRHRIKGILNGEDYQIVFSDTPSELSGTLQSASGQPTTDYYIVLLPEDRALWQQKSRRILSARPATTGRFVFSNVPAGSYVVAALTDLDALDLLDMSFLEQIAPAGVKVIIGEAEKKVQDLRIK